MHRDEVLNNAKLLISGARDGEYGSPRKNFEMIAVRWGQILGVGVTPTQVAMMMTDLKMARAITGVPKADTFLDLVGYAAIAGELATTDGVDAVPRRATSLGLGDLDPNYDGMKST